LNGFPRGLFKKNEGQERIIPLGFAASLDEELLPGLRMRYPKGHSTYGRVKVKIIPLGFAASLVEELFLGKYNQRTKEPREINKTKE